jgi:transposase-like protein
VAKLREIEVKLSQGKDVLAACREAGVTDKSYYRWRREYGGLKVDQARRLKQLEKENARLKRLVGELHLEKAVLTDVARGNF